MDEQSIVNVFLDNINPIIGERDLDYVRGPFMDMIYILIEKEKFLLRFGQLKYTYSSKDNYKKSYQRNENNQVSMVKPSTLEEKEPLYKLPIAPT